MIPADGYGRPVLPRARPLRPRGSVVDGDSPCSRRARVGPACYRCAIINAGRASRRMLMLFPPVRRWLSLVVVTLTLTLLPLSGPPVTLAAAPEASRPIVSDEAWFEVEQPPTVPFEAVQLIVDFPAGSRVGRHTHGGPGYITMLEKELTMW